MIKCCEWCGKEFEDNTKNKNKKYCSPQCRRKMEFKRRLDKSIYSYEDWMINYPKYKQEDYKLKFTDKDLSFTENDNKWGLGESNLTEHAHEDYSIEYYLVKGELNRIFSRKPNP